MANEFDEFLEQNYTPTALATNDLMSRDIPPDREAEVAQWADKLRASRSFVRENLEDIKKNNAPDSMKYESMALKTPKTAAWLSDPDKFAIASDEIDRLNEIERTIDDHSKLSEISKLSSSFQSGLAGFYSSLASTPAYLYSLGAVPQNLVYKLAGVPERQVRPPEWTYNNPVTRYFKENEEALKTPEMNIEVGDEIAAGNFKRAAIGVLHQGLASSPSMLMSMAGYAAGVGPAALALAGTQAATGAVVEGEQQGFDPLQSTFRATAIGGFEALTEKVGTFGVLQKWETALASRYGQSSAKQVMKELAQVIGYSMASEATEEGINSLAADITTAMTVDPTALEGAGTRALGAAAIGGGMGLISAPGASRAAAYKYKQSVMARDTYSKLGDAVNSLKLSQRSQSDTKSYLDVALGGSGMESVFLPVETAEAYFQSKNIPTAKVMSELGVDDSYAAAQQTGGDIEIPLSTWASKMAATEHYQGLKDQVRFDLDGLSPQEHQQLQQEAQGVAEEATADQGDLLVDSARAFKRESRQLENAAFDMLSEMKPKAEARSDAKMLARVYANAARSNNITPMQMFERFPFQIQKGNVVAPEALMQSKYGEMVYRPDMPDAVQVTSVSQEQIDKFKTTKEARDWAVNNLRQKSIRNTQTGMDISMSVKGFKKVAGGVNIPATKYALANIDTLTKNAVYDGFEVSDKKERVRGYHRFYAPMQIGNQSYLVRIKASDANDGLFFYHEIAVENKWSGGNLLASQDQSLNETQADAGPSMSIQDLISSVNETRKTYPFFQQTPADVPYPAPNVVRGAVQFQYKDGKKTAVITLTPNADRSTFQHEMAHLYLEMLGDLAQVDATPGAVKDDFAKVLKWLGVESKEQITREHHEKFAEGFESYLMEGKAPTSDLKTVFRRFKLWLLDVYKTLKPIVELNDDIRGVYDRMLAAQDEIDQLDTTEMQIDDLAQVLGEKKAQQYLELQPEAKAAAEEILGERLIQELLDQQKADYKEALRIQTQIATNQVNADPVYQVIDKIENGTDPMGIYPTLKLNRADARARLGETVYPMLAKSLTTAEGGMPADLAATLYGFENGNELLNALAQAEDKQTKIKRLAEDAVQQDFPDLFVSPELSNEAVRAYHNENKSKLLQLQMEYIFEQGKGITNEATRRMIARLPRREAIKSEAVKALSQMKARTVKPAQFLRAERKAASEGAKAFVKKDWAKAFEFKRKEAIAHEMYREAMKIKEMADKDKREFKKLFKKDDDLAKSRDMAIVNVARQVLIHNQFAPESLLKTDALAQFKRYNPEQYASLEPVLQQAMRLGVTRDNMTVDDYVAMSEMVRDLWVLAKSNNEMRVEGRKLQLEKVTQELKQQLVDSGFKPDDARLKSATSEKERAMTKWINFKHSFRRVESWADSFDFTNKNKPFQKYIVRPVLNATAKYRVAKADAFAEVVKLADEMRSALTYEPIYSPELDYTFQNKGQILGMMLHLGNRSNASKLVRGYNWGSVNEDGSVEMGRVRSFLDKLAQQGVVTKKDWDFVQTVWDILEKYKPDAQKAHYEMFGHYFNEVTAETIQTPFGEYKGGYFPAKADPYRSASKEMFDLQNDILENNAAFAFPTAGRGSTMTRNERYAAPLSLELNQISSHIDWVLKFTYIEPAVRQTTRLLKHSDMAESIEAYDRGAVNRMLIPWLQRAASQKVSEWSKGKSDMDDGIRYLRRNQGANIMFANVNNTLQQYTGFSLAMTKVKPTYLAKGLSNLVRSPRAFTRNIADQSEFMKTRLGGEIFDIASEMNSIFDKKTVYGSTKEWTQKNTYLLQSMAQNQIDSVVWHGAYEQAVENGETHDQAVLSADSVVRATQGSVNPEDSASIEARNELQRAIFMFYSYFNMQGNLVVTEISKAMRGDGGISRAGLVYMLAVAAPAALTTLIAEAMRGSFDLDDDESIEELLKEMLFISQVKAIGAPIPLGSAAINVIMGQLTEKQYDDRMSLSPAFSSIDALGAVVRVPGKIIDGEELKRKDIRDVFTLIGIASGLPVAPLSKPLMYLQSVESGQANPENPIDFARGLVTGSPGVAQ